MPEATTAGRRITAAERHAEVIRLRKAGLSYDAIAKATGYGNKGTVFQIVKKHLGDVREKLSEDRDDLRALEVERLDHLQRSLWVKATNGDAEAVRTILRLMQRRAAMLGLDVPVEFELRLGIEQVDYLEAVLRRVLDAVQTMLAQAGFEEFLREAWPTVLGELVPRELEAAALAVGPQGARAGDGA